MKLELSQQSFENGSDIKFHQIPLTGSRVVQCGGQTDSHEANSRFRNFANAPKHTPSNDTTGI